MIYKKDIVNKIMIGTLLAFIMAFFICIGLIIYRFIKKNEDEYIPFGPFLALAALCMMFLDSGTIFIAFLSFCKILSDIIVRK